MLNAIVIDDEVSGVESLQFLLKENCPNIKIVAAETLPEKGIEQIEKHRPDVVFLDIEMPEMTGFELLKKLKHLSFHVIFTTAYDNYAIKAFKYNAIDYLLKPIIIEELVDAVNKLEERSKSGQAQTDVSKLLETILVSQNQGKLAISGYNEIVYVDANNIIRLESDSNYTTVILLGGKKIVSAKTLKEYEALLSSGNFFRTHKTFIVNLDHVEKYVKTDGGYLVTTDNFQVPVSREKRQGLLVALGSK